MANSVPAFDFGAAAMFEPMMKAFGENVFANSLFSGAPGGAAQATAAPAADFGAAAMFEPMMKAFGQAFPGGAFGEAPASGAMPGFEMFSFDPAALSDPGAGREPENPMETWLSLFPTAPMFGVRWAFWPMLSPWIEPWMPVDGAGAPSAVTRSTLTGRAAREKEALSVHGLARSLEGPRSSEPEADALTAREPAPRDQASVVVHLPTRAAPAAPARIETRPATPEKSATARTETAKLTGTKAPVAKSPAAKSPAAKSPAAKSPAAKAPVAKAPVAKTPAAKAPVAKTPVAKTAAAKAPATRARTPKTRAAAPKRGADGRPAGLFTKAPARVDDLKKIKGVGEKLEMVLNDLGIYQYKQIAGFVAEDYAWLDSRLGAFKGRGLRDDWTAQAKALLKK